MRWWSRPEEEPLSTHPGPQPGGSQCPEQVALGSSWATSRPSSAEGEVEGQEGPSGPGLQHAQGPDVTGDNKGVLRPTAPSQGLGRGRNGARAPLQTPTRASEHPRLDLKQQVQSHMESTFSTPASRFP